MLSTALQKVGIFLLLVAAPVFSHSACIDVVDLRVELPPQSVTDSGVMLSYQYDLISDQYSLSWTRQGTTSQMFGPFPMTMSCGTPSVRWENEEFLLMGRGCGTFCWYVKIFYLVENAGNEVPYYQRIESPLAFDPERNLLAYYHAQDVIGVRNLISGQTQLIDTAYACEFRSGLCFNDVRFDGQLLRYNWRRGQQGEPLSAPLAN